MFFWNPVFKFVIDIKNDYIIKNGTISYEQKEKNGKMLTCLEDWVDNLNNNVYSDMLSNLQINQNDNMVLIRYGRYSDVYGGEEDITNDTFWDMYDGFYKECRSIVIDVKNEVIVLSPFKKFRNLNECEENSLENIINKISYAKSIEVSNKLDGSMQCARYYDNKIIMAGSQSLDIKKSWRLEDGYNKLMESQNYVAMITENPEYTFIFEYISLKDAHVVSYKQEQEGLYLIGIRNVYDGNQMSYKDVISLSKKYGVLSTTIFNKTIEEIMEDTKKYKSNEMEGYVLNIDGYFVKIKCDDYAEIHKILSKMSSINLIIKAIADDFFDDLISKIPEVYMWRVLKVANIVLKYINNTKNTVEEYFEKAPKEDRKCFMMWVDNNVPKEYLKYVKNKYLGKENNYIKDGNELAPKYKKLKEMGVNESYSEIFLLEE